MTTGDRLTLLSGLSGVAASVMLAAIGAGATTGDALVNYSTLPTATAEEHLLTGGGGGGGGTGSNYYIVQARRRHRR